MTQPTNHGKHWTPDELISLRRLVKGNTPTRLIALKLKRTTDAIEAKCSELGISLEPHNQSPYGTAGKKRS